MDRTQNIIIPPFGLAGLLRLPSAAKGFVIFVHGSGSSRLSPRNNRVASALAERGLASLLFDLLTEEEAADRSNVFDIDLLADRLLAACHWRHEYGNAAALPVAYFGASTGAAAALVAAAKSPADVRAIVSRGGRPDLAGAWLPKVMAPTLLIVGGDDTEVIALNRAAQRHLRCERKLSIVPGAGHLFEEPGTMERVTELATHWFLNHLATDKRMVVR